MKWYIQLDDFLYPYPDNPSSSEHEAEEKIRGYLCKRHNRGWDAFRVFQAADDRDAFAKVEKWKKDNGKK